MAPEIATGHFDRTMSIDSSVSTDTSVSTDASAPAATDALPGSVAPDAEDAPAAFSDTDGATTPGGPTMIWIFTGIFVTITWLRRRYRNRRQQR